MGSGREIFMVCIAESFDASVKALAILVNLWQMWTAQIWALGQSSFDSGRLLTICFPEVAFPQGLKPEPICCICGTTEVVPFQNSGFLRCSLALPSQVP